MKFLQKFLSAAVLISAAVFMFSCNLTPAEDTSTPADNSADVAAVTAVKEQLSVTGTVLNTDSFITLPASVTGYGSVMITWASSDTSVIAVDGKVTIPEGIAIESVTLTATITQNGYSVKKIFTVTVYQKDADMLDDAYVNAAKGKLSVTYDAEIYADQTVTLPTTVTAGGKNVSVEWSTADSTHLALSSGKDACIIHRDIVDVTGSLTAKVSYGTASDTKNINITVKRVPKISYKYNGDSYSDTSSYTFDGSTLTYETASISDSSTYKSGKKYSYTVDADKKSITVSVIEGYINDTWYTKDAYTTYMKNTIGANAEAFKNIAASSAPTIDTLLAAEQASDSSITKEMLENMLVSGYSSLFNNVTTVEEFEKLSAEQISRGLKEFCENIRSQSAAQYGLSSDASWDDIVTAAQEWAVANIDSIFRQDAVYTYSIETVGYSSYDNNLKFNTIAQWASGLCWWKQNGDFEDESHNRIFYESASPSSSNIEYNDTYYYGSFNSTFTTFIVSATEANGTKTAAKGTWSVSCDSTNHTVTATDNADSSKTFTASFQGDPL
jgi:hypothetical protein